MVSGFGCVQEDIELLVARHWERNLPGVRAINIQIKGVQIYVEQMRTQQFYFMDRIPFERISHIELWPLACTFCNNG